MVLYTFYLFAVLTVFSAFMVVIQTNPVRSVLFLVLAFFSSAVLWLLVNAEFLALILILVYVGAVMTLFLFVVMMLNIDIEANQSKLAFYAPLSLIFVAFLTIILIKILPVAFDLPLSIPESNQSDTLALGLVLYTDYCYAFELAAVVLLTAMIAAIVLVHRPSVKTRKQSVQKQIMTQKKDRIIIVKNHSKI